MIYTYTHCRIEFTLKIHFKIFECCIKLYKNVPMNTLSIYGYALYSSLLELMFPSCLSSLFVFVFLFPLPITLLQCCLQETDFTAVCFYFFTVIQVGLGIADIPIAKPSMPRPPSHSLLSRLRHGQMLSR